MLIIITILFNFHFNNIYEFRMNTKMRVLHIVLHFGKEKKCRAYVLNEFSVHYSLTLFKMEVRILVARTKTKGIKA